MEEHVIGHTLEIGNSSGDHGVPSGIEKLAS